MKTNLKVYNKAKVRAKHLRAKKKSETIKTKMPKNNENLFNRKRKTETNKNPIANDDDKFV